MEVTGWRLIAGMAGAVLAGATLAILADAIYRGGADAGDWLQFFGGAIGAALAVLGSVYFDVRKEERALMRRRINSAKVVDDLCSYLAGLSSSFADPTDSADSFKSDLSHAYDRVESARLYLELFPITDLDDLETARRLVWARQFLANFGDLLKHESGLDQCLTEASRVTTRESMAKYIVAMPIVGGRLARRLRGEAEPAVTEAT